MDELGHIDDVPLDPSKAETFSLVEGLLEEISRLFPDDYIHIGGDEVSNPSLFLCFLCPFPPKKEKEKRLSCFQLLINLINLFHSTGQVWMLGREQRYCQFYERDWDFWELQRTRGIFLS